MAINKKLIHFKNKQKFEEELANNNILSTSICFIQDTKEIWTHGTIYCYNKWNTILTDSGSNSRAQLGASSSYTAGTIFIKIKFKLVYE